MPHCAISIPPLPVTLQTLGSPSSQKPPVRLRRLSLGPTFCPVLNSLKLLGTFDISDYLSLSTGFFHRHCTHPTPIGYRFLFPLPVPQRCCFSHLLSLQPFQSSLTHDRTSQYSHCALPSCPLCHRVPSCPWRSQSQQSKLETWATTLHTYFLPRPRRLTLPAAS